MVSFEIFVKAMPPSLSELKVLPSFCFAFKIPDDVATSNIYIGYAAAIATIISNGWLNSSNPLFNHPRLHFFFFSVFISPEFDLSFTEELSGPTAMTLGFKLDDDDA